MRIVFNYLFYLKQIIEYNTHFKMLKDELFTFKFIDVQHNWNELTKLCHHSSIIQIFHFMEVASILQKKTIRKKTDYFSLSDFRRQNRFPRRSVNIHQYRLALHAFGWMKMTPSFKCQLWYSMFFNPLKVWIQTSKYFPFTQNMIKSQRIIKLIRENLFISNEFKTYHNYRKNVLI